MEKEYKRKWQKLVDKLLAIGGTRVVEVYEEDLDKLLSRGETISGKPRLVKRGMKRSRCHQNSVYYYDDYVKRNVTLDKAQQIQIITGWSLSDDGLWRQHTWLKLKNEIIETTTIRESYFGFALQGQELQDFCWNNM